MASKVDEMPMDRVREYYEDFVQTLREHERFNSRRLPFDPVQCSWQEVMKELEIATKAASLNQQGDKNFFTKNRRKLSSLSRSIVPLLNAIPDDLCFLHGGLAIIFHLAAQRESVRRSILDTFEDIPTIIIVACNKSHRFPSDIRLEKSIVDLKRTLFAVIPDLIKLLMPDTFVAKVTSLFRGFDLPDMLALIKRKSLAVDSLARDLQDELVFETCLATRKIQEVTANTHSGVEKLQVAILKLQHLISDNITTWEQKDEYLD
ncbi:hypothetical protein ONS95_009148 [Cadophora gregata]|uniref:uncharacterized protein n=1 Tax=Cadophora gregata TaxID=51156 RepID=UPI0026DBD258|nr:uncharacterized protein ONS95_009148 [Cadophora gregata]KAK0124166.1 hypothetical protein ONS95_009148 [Cadophora gregata]KAK0130494.1 hypothetical protein ONS96_001013 [Cadophora gregata f. sp. sojae]